ncbi:MAG TPA: hypothetical protein VIM11_10145 [Tepidisphaeraceae bacterium]|jgi:hypothetical protein
MTLGFARPANPAAPFAFTRLAKSVTGLYGIGARKNAGSHAATSLPALGS